MRSSVALVVAVIVIFGAAMAAEFGGFVHRDASVATADAGVDGADSVTGSESAITPAVEKQLRNGLVGGFVLLCLYIVLRQSGVLM